MKECIAAGCTKLNVNRVVLDDYYAHFRKHAPTMSHTKLMEETTEKVISQTIEWMEICGSAGKA